MTDPPTDQHERYATFLPQVLNWIDLALAAHARFRRPVRSFGFQRLCRYFSQAVLSSAGVVVVDRVSVPPLSALGLTEFNNFETQDAAAITYRDTYFVQVRHAQSETLHFHELVHVIQWRVLGPERFLLLYADGLARHGYAQAPLEQIAFLHQSRFDAGQPGYAVEAEVLEQTLRLAEAGLRIDSKRRV